MEKNIGMDISRRPRRNRRTDALRRMLRETEVRPSDMILPMFVTEASEKEEITSMPGCFRLDRGSLVEEAMEAYRMGIPAVALFPVIADKKKDSKATECLNPDGLLQCTLKDLKNAVPELMVVTDVAMDPYSSDGHDGYVENGEIVNDITLEILAEMAVAQAEAGADIIAPSDMMDGRVGAIRTALDAASFSDIGILSYSAKYASSFYGPFRDALDSAPRHGDKKTYQMDPANAEEAVREVLLDIEEGADMVMVKPALAYLDVIRLVKEISDVPVAAYNVSGEYAMIKAAADKGWLDEKACMLEMVTAIKRAGADVILTYFAKDIVRELNR
jgi:porphobilinogen synthase